ncbi:uncharacterized protein OCT59_015674 [Rhizophagus irregularis]|uniref:uncharacterized protein n=1 Tax=Rhizophagus irregularis TaxID=588596 RepID=UPI0019DA81BB|nr:hypothetical protein OCT59_015674 [Rhizophagus irregularis]GET55606.1 stress-activated map kinase interacting protein 1-domain-containing protein [Rhizophagus irregularis DAOM 181602=DAOM 197198]
MDGNLIGYTLYQYWDEKREPALEPKFCDVLQWTTRIVEDDGEIDFDFPAVDPYPLRLYNSNSWRSKNHPSS